MCVCDIYIYIMYKYICILFVYILYKYLYIHYTHTQIYLIEPFPVPISCRALPIFALFFETPS